MQPLPMQPMIRTSRLLLLVIVAAMTLPAATAQADDVSAPVTGFLDDGGNFEGTIKVNRFRSTSTGMVISALLVGTVTDSDGNVTDVLSTRITAPIADLNALGDCHFLLFSMDPIDLRFRDFTLHLDPFDASISSDSFGIKAGTRLCRIADNFANGLFTLTTRELNDLLDVIREQ